MNTFINNNINLLCCIRLPSTGNQTHFHLNDGCDDVNSARGWNSLPSVIVTSLRHRHAALVNEKCSHYALQVKKIAQTAAQERQSLTAQHTDPATLIVTSRPGRSSLTHTKMLLDCTWQNVWNVRHNMSHTLLSHSNVCCWNIYSLGCSQDLGFRG